MGSGHSCSSAGTRADHATSGHLPSLDGLRAFAIALVLIAHLGHTGGFSLHLPNHLVGDLGNLGVRIFFVLSGFLITELMLREERRTGTVSLRQFYLRRSLRIFPAFYVFLISLWVASRFGWVTFPARDQVAAATYTMNFLRDQGWYAGHTWSLAVEEQFYLLWPGLFLLVGARRRTAVVLAVIAVTPLVRLAISALYPSWRPMIGELFPTIMDAIAMGVALALLRSSLHARGWYRRALASPLLYILPVTLLACNAFNATWTRPGWLLGETALNLLIVIGIDRAVTHADGIIGRGLNLAWVRWVGALSYSIYLWQQPFLSRGGTVSIQRFPLALVMIVVAAMASYYLIERPALAMKAKLSGARPTLAARATGLEDGLGVEGG